MLRHLGLIAVCACIVASVGCGRDRAAPSLGPSLAPSSPPSPPPSFVTVEFGGRVVDADAGGPIGNVRVSIGVSSIPDSRGWVFPTNTAMSGGDGTFTLPLNLPMGWRWVSLQLTAPPGYDDGGWRFEPNTAGIRAEIRIYPMVVIRPGESRQMRVEPDVLRCAFAGPFSCRRVLIDAPPGEPVELEIVPHDTSKPMGLVESAWEETTVPRLMVAPGGNAYVYGPGTATLTARR